MKKNVLMLFVMTFFTTFIFGQKIKIKDNDVFVDDKLYCKMEDQGKPLRPEYSIKNLEGKELIFVKYTVLDNVKDPANALIYFTVMFLETGDKTELAPDFSFKKQLIKGLYQNNVIVDNALNPEGVKAFIMKNGQDLSSNFLSQLTNVGNTSSSNNGVEYFIMERNRSAKISVFGDDIKQDFKVIGTFTSNQKAQAGGIWTSYSIYNSKGQLVATAKSQMGESNYEMTTAKDNKTHFGSSKNDFKSSFVEAMAEQLTDLLYL